MPDLPVQPPKSLTFIADAMLGRLARWLRILGYDTAYEKVISDEGLIERVLRESRWLLTRDSRLTRRGILRGRYTLITSDHIEGQLRQLHHDLRLDLETNPQRGYRCADCNVVLAAISHQDAARLVPPFVAKQYHEFLQCPHCCRVFWSGTHWENFQKRLAAVKGEKTLGHE